MFDRITQRYQGKSIVVIGAGGIGGEIIDQLRSVAGEVFVADHDAARLHAIAATPSTARIITHQLDVRQPQAIESLIVQIESGKNPPDFLFYTAGVLNIESFADTTTEIWNRAIDVNLNGIFHCVRLVSKGMCQRKQGSILILGSISGTKARSGSRVNPVYNTTKAAVAAFVNATAMQLRPHGVRINCISPGPTATSMMDIQPAAVHTAVNEIMLDHRMNGPDEVAELALFVAAHGRFTGEDVPLGGGAGLGA